MFKEETINQIKKNVYVALNKSYGYKRLVMKNEIQNNRGHCFDSPNTDNAILEYHGDKTRFILLQKHAISLNI